MLLMHEELARARIADRRSAAERRSRQLTLAVVSRTCGTYAAG